MDSIKAITGKNPADYEPAVKNLVDNSEVELFKRLVDQDDFLFDFIKTNVAKRIFNACNKNNFKNILNFFEYYSPSYDAVFAEILKKYGDDDIFNQLCINIDSESDSYKAYILKYLSLFDGKKVLPLIDKVRTLSKSEFEPVSINAIEILSKLNDGISKEEAICKLHSDDEFVQYDGVKFLVNYGAKDCVDKIIEVMKSSSFSENIASELMYLVPLEELLEKDYDNGILVLCNILNAIPELVSLDSIIDYNLAEVLEKLSKNISSSSAIALLIAKDTFSSLAENDEYLFDCDKNTKEEIVFINKLLSGIKDKFLKQQLYEELYEESDFVFYAVDYADNIQELETLLDSSNQTLLLKVLTVLKEKNVLNVEHKNKALNNITNENIISVVNAL